MASLEEKIKAFLGDEKKVEALKKDEAFLEKISSGTASPSDISQKFANLGLPLSTDEAEQVNQTATKILDTPAEKIAEKLGDVELKTVSGGLEDEVQRKLGIGSLVASGVIQCVGLGSVVAGAICQFKARKADEGGNKTESETLNTTAKKLYIAGASTLGASAVPLLGGAILIGTRDPD